MSIGPEIPDEVATELIAAFNGDTRDLSVTARQVLNQIVIEREDGIDVREIMGIENDR